jgi:hypothetical protein
MQIKSNSSVFSEFNYNEKTSALDISFNNGNIYRYQDVPQDKVNEMSTATSMGQYFNRNIRDVYQSVKI